MSTQVTGNAKVTGKTTPRPSCLPPKELPEDADWLVIPRGPVWEGEWKDDSPLFRLHGRQAYLGVELICHDDRHRLWEGLVPAALLEEWITGLPGRPAERLRRRLAMLENQPPPLVLADGRRLDLCACDRPRLMGIVNVTPDSFSDGGRFVGSAEAIAHARALAAAGAAILDIGGESTRPGAEPVPVEEELARVLPVVEALAADGHLISIDTRKSVVAKAALAAGAAIVNDVSAGCYDPEMAAVVAEAQAPVILMHARGDPQTMQQDPRYEDALLEVYQELAAGMRRFLDAGVRAQNIVIDPGIGFGKRLADNIALIRNIGALHALGKPVLLGASRKSFIRALGGAEQACERLGGSLAAALAAAQAGVAVLRVHDVAATREALAVARALGFDA